MRRGDEKSGSIRRALGLGVIGFLALGAAAFAGDDPSNADEPSPDGRQIAGEAESGTAAPASGLWVFLEPETGEIAAEPTPAQEALRRSLARSMALNKSSDGLVPFELEDGGRGVFLQGRFRHALVASFLEDGTFAYRCSDHPEELLVPGTAPVSGDVEAPLR